MNESIKHLVEARNKLADVYEIGVSHTEKLRQILELELNRKVSFSEAQVIGSQLASLYRSLSKGKLITKEPL